MKKYVLDASALFAFLRDSHGASKVDELLREALAERARVLMSAVNHGEVYGLILRQFGPEQALTIVQAVNPLPVEVLDATAERARKAADVKVKYKLHYTDSFAAALAIEHQAKLVTSDSDFRKLGHRFPIIWLKS
jgi:predicted nucleic acid-binding protein